MFCLIHPLQYWYSYPYVAILALSSIILYMVWTQGVSFLPALPFSQLTLVFYFTYFLLLYQACILVPYFILYNYGLLAITPILYTIIYFLTIFICIISISISCVFIVYSGMLCPQLLYIFILPSLLFPISLVDIVVSSFKGYILLLCGFVIQRWLRFVHSSVC